ncbi:MAG: YkgJ family cysteine cluster protein [Alphaproteobacteria bacterium]|nr:YkgJ family cysteine cluster protein [Alphaproteobacteria bacterium]
MTGEISESLTPEAVFAMGDLMQALSDAVDTPGLEERPHGALPEPFERALAAFYEAYDRYLAARLSLIPVRCGQGCAHCCRDNPRGSSGVELMVLWRAARALPDGEALLEAAAARGARYAERLRRLGGEDAAIAETKAAGDACVFLSEAGACRVYAARPVACRMFFSITEPAWCAQRHPRHAEARNPHLAPPPVARMMLDEISRRLGLAQVPRDLSQGVVEVAGRLSGTSGRRSST